MRVKMIERAIVASLASVCLAGPALAQTGTWGATRTLEGPFAAGSIPEPPLTTMNVNGHALLVWNATGIVRYADHLKGGTWLPRGNVPGGGTGAGPVAVAIGNSEAAAIAYATAATRYVPSKLMVSLRPAGGSFGAAVEPAPGAAAGALTLGIACDGSVTLVWSNAIGVWASSLAGTGRIAGACDGQPGSGSWSAPQLLSNGHTGAGLPALVVNDAGAALAVWQEGAPGSPTSIVAAYRPAGETWQAALAASAPTARPTWNPKPGLDAAGNAAIGYLDGNSMVIVARQASGAWGTPTLLSGSQAVYYPAFAMSARGDLLAAWLALDASNMGSVWAVMAPAGGSWSPGTRLSARADQADWPTAAYAGDGSVALVGWTDNGTNTAKVSIYAGSTWTRRNLGVGYWSGPVPVAAGSGAAVAGWAMPNLANPNAARLVTRAWE